MEEFLGEILRVYRKKVLFTRHALNQMNLAERMILRNDQPKFYQMAIFFYYNNYVGFGKFALTILESKVLIKS